MATATVVEEGVGGFFSPATRYRLSEPLDGWTHVLVFTAEVGRQRETIITPGDPLRKIATVVRLPGSITGFLDHAKALGVAGYEIVAEQEEDTNG